MANERWWIMKSTALGHELPPFYGTEPDAEVARQAHVEKTGKVVRMEPADPSNRTHVERVEKELETRKEFRDRGLSGYDDAPALSIGA